MQTHAAKRQPYLLQTETDEAVEHPTVRRASRWPGRLLFLFALCVTFAVLERAFVLGFSGTLILGLVLGFLLRNVE